MDVASDLGIAQPDEQMFERNIAHMAKDMREVTITLESGTEWVGFIAGLDQTWIEICLSDTSDKLILARDMVESVLGTKRRLSSLPKSAMTDRIRRRVEAFSEVCQQRLGSSR